MECMLCGSKNADRRAKVEGTIVNVCDNCVKYGDELAKVEIRKVQTTIRTPKELEEVAVENFSEIVKRERQKKNLTQEQLALKLVEKQSIIKRIEEGWEPSASTLRKLERFFGVKLIETAISGKITGKKEKKSLTIGDVIEIG